MKVVLMAREPWSTGPFLTGFASKLLETLIWLMWLILVDWVDWVDACLPVKTEGRCVNVRFAHQEEKVCVEDAREAKGGFCSWIGFKMKRGF